MKEICAWHPKYFGEELLMREKPPLEDKSETHGICPVCQAIFEGKLRVYKVCPHCGKKGLYEKDHYEQCRYCDLKRILTPVNGW